MKKICIITTCRADYGYLYWIMKDIQASTKLSLQIILPINHHEANNILAEFDCTYLTSPISSTKDYGQFYSDCHKIMSDTTSDMVVVLGDRFETHAAVTAALLLNIPIAHIAGGETTTGSFDNELRNSITMMADIHFTSTFKYAENVARMKNLCTPDHYSCYYKANDIIRNYPYKYEGNIYNVGSPGLDWLTRAKLLSKDELQQHVSIDLNQPFIVASFHPVTKELNKTYDHAVNYFNALNKCNTPYIFIMPNIDPTNEIIRSVIFKHEKNCIVDNLDHLTYLSLLQYAEMMVGNSSSGIIESASLNLPAINAGNRQAGRIRNSNVVDCGYKTEEILEAINYVKNGKGMKQYLEKNPISNVYGDGKSSERIVKILEGI